MKKLILVIMALAIALTFTSCNKKDQISKTKNNEISQKQKEKKNEKVKENKDTEESKAEFETVNNLIDFFKDWNNYEGTADVTFVDRDLTFGVYVKNEKQYKINFSGTDTKELLGTTKMRLTQYEPTRSDEIIYQEENSPKNFLNINGFYYTNKDDLTLAPTGDKYMEDYSPAENNYPMVGVDFGPYSDEEDLGIQMLKMVSNKKMFFEDLKIFLNNKRFNFEKESETKFSLKIKDNDILKKLSSLITESEPTYKNFFEKVEDSNGIERFVFNPPSNLGGTKNQRFNIIASSIRSFFNGNMMTSLDYPFMEFSISFEKKSDNEVEVKYELINNTPENDDQYLREPGHQIGMSFTLNMKKSERPFEILDKNLEKINKSFTSGDLSKFPKGLNYKYGYTHMFLESKNVFGVFVEGPIENESEIEYYLESIKEEENIEPTYEGGAE